MTDDELIARANIHFGGGGWAIVQHSWPGEVTVEHWRTWQEAVAARRHYPTDVLDEDDPDYSHTLILRTYTTYTDEED